MKHREKGGIAIGETVHIMMDKEAKSTWQMAMFQMLAVLIGTWSMISILIDCFAIPVVMIYVNIMILLATVAFFPLYHWKTHVFIKETFFGILFGIAICFYWDQLKNGLYIVENFVIERCNFYLDYQTTKYIADNSRASEDTTILSIFIVAFIAVFLSMTVLHNKYKSICYIIMLLPVAGSFVVGITPKAQYLIAYMISFIVIIKLTSANSNSLSKDQTFQQYIVNYRVAVILSIMILAFLGFIRIVIPPAKYKEVVQLNDIKTDIQTYMFGFSIEEVTDKFLYHTLPNFLGRGKVSGGLAGGKLGKADHVSFDGSEQLRATVPLRSFANGIYLKGYVGSVYTGDSWEGLSKKMRAQYKKLLKIIPEKEFALVNMSNLLFTNLSELNSNPLLNSPLLNITNTFNNKYKLYKGKMNIEYQDANRSFLYAPYYTDFTKQEKIEYVQDLYAAPLKKRDRYEFDYYFNISLEKDLEVLLSADLVIWSEEYMEFENAYRDYVYDIYTRLPDQGVELLKKDFTMVKENYQVEKIMERIAVVKDYLKDNTEYTLSPGALPKGKDYVEYFLYESHKGYCAHYATAATLMLRAMGVPARYVEGYFADTSNIIPGQQGKKEMITSYSDQMIYQEQANQVEILVKDSDAHAWVEVYIDGCGWFPVEFTPGTSSYEEPSIVETMLVLQDKINQDSKPSITPAPILTPATITQALANEGNKEQNVQETIARQKPKITKVTISLIFTILLLIVLYILGQHLILVRKKHNKRNTDDLSKKALLLYEEIEHLFQLYPAYEKEKFDDYALSLEIALKARFDKKWINRKELQVVEAFHYMLVRKVYQEASLRRKVYLKLFLAI